jgi:hypothetical protein
MTVNKIINNRVPHVALQAPNHGSAKKKESAFWKRPLLYTALAVADAAGILFSANGWGSSPIPPPKEPTPQPKPDPGLEPNSGMKAVTKVDALKNKQQDHLAKLNRLARAGHWQHLQMHTDHPDSGFDWWMFLIDRASTGYGDQYRVSQRDIEALMNDPIFMKNYRNGVLLVTKSWGWDLEQRKDVTNRVQKWTNYQVRLGKMLDSLRLFKQDDLRIAITDFIDQKGISPTLEPWIQRLLFKTHN